MAGYRLSEKADADFDTIYEYGLINFGEFQANKYAYSLIDTFVTVGAYSLSGRERYDISDGLRCYIVRNHAVYYIIKDDYIEIVRILHQSMNATDHL